LHFKLETALLNSGEFDLATISSGTPVSISIRLIADLFPDYTQTPE